MQNLMVFEGHDVEVFELNGQVLFNPYHVGACLEIGENGVKTAVSKMNAKQVVKLTNSKVAKYNLFSAPSHFWVGTLYPEVTGSVCLVP